MGQGKHCRDSATQRCQSMMRVLAAVAAAFVLIAADPGPLIDSIAQPVTQNGVTVELISPVAGATVGGNITLYANASSLAGPITRVEFYVDGVLVGTSTNRTPAPDNLRVVQ